MHNTVRVQDMTSSFGGCLQLDCFNSVLFLYTILPCLDPILSGTCLILSRSYLMLSGSYLILSWSYPILSWSCLDLVLILSYNPVWILSGLDPTVSYPVLILSCLDPILSWSYLVLILSCLDPILSWSCLDPILSCLDPVLILSWSYPILSGSLSYLISQLSYHIPCILFSSPYCFSICSFSFLLPPYSLFPLITFITQPTWSSQHPIHYTCDRGPQSLPGCCDVHSAESFSCY